MMDADDIRQRLEQAFPDGSVTAVDSTGTGDHFTVTVASRAFEGRTLVERHQLVYAALGTLMPRIHAVQLRTVVPGER